VKRLVGAAPWIFIVIWSSGFVVAKYSYADADALYFLAVRLLLAAAILFAITIALRQPIRISRRHFQASLVIGISLNGLYLAGVWYAIELGAPAGLSSVITSMQPIIVSILAVKMLKESLSKRQVAGLVLGLCGVVLVIYPKLSIADGFTFESLGFLLVALAGSTMATLMQKKIGQDIPLLIGTTYQFAVAGIGLLLISVVQGRTRLDITHTSVWTMTWAVAVTSIAAVLLLLWLLNRGSAAKVSSLLYLVPPMAVVQAYILFGEKVSLMGIVGIAISVLGVALVIRS
jgi:drug/metabolite transporter (DMT)-like permease